MKSLKAFLLAFSFILSASSFAGEQELSKISAAVDAVILGNKLTDLQLAELNKGQTDIEIVVDGATHKVSVSLKRESGIHVLSFANRFHSLPQSNAILDCDNQNFKVTYAYANRLVWPVSQVVYRFTVTGDVLTALCAPQETVAIAPQNNIPLESPKLEKHASLDSGHSDTEEIDNDAFVDALSAPASEDEASKNEDESSNSDDEDASVEQTPVGIIGALTTRLDRITTLTSKLLPVAGQADHIYSMLAGSLRGGAGILSALSSRSLGDAIVATADLASAVTSGVRAYRAVFGSSQKTNALFKKLDNNLSLVSSLASETGSALRQIRRDVENANTRLDEVIIGQRSVLEQLQNSTTAQDNDARLAMQDLEDALKQLHEGKGRLEAFAQAANGIEEIWGRAFSLLSEVENALVDPIDGDKEALRARVATVHKNVEEIKELLVSLQEPWKVILDAFSELSHLNEVFGNCISNQSTFCVNVLKRTAAMEQRCLEQSENIKLLQNTRQANSCVVNDLGFVLVKTDEIDETLNDAKGNVVELKKEVDKKYDLVHLVVGATAAIVSASFVAGTLPPAALGLLVCQVAKAMDSSCCVDQDNELTFFGRLLWGCGMDKERVKALGRKYLRRTYASDKKVDNDDHKPNANN